jgi:hypothetical protein
MGCSFQSEWDKSSGNSDLSVCHPAFQTGFRVTNQMVRNSASKRQSLRAPLHPPSVHTKSAGASVMSNK